VKIFNGDHMEYELEHQGVDPKERSDWPYPSFDAMDWAKEFNKRFPMVSVDDALPWFANALMRGFDQGSAR